MSHEENDARLIKAAMGEEARPRPEVEQRALRLLKAEQQTMQESADFPLGILTVLVGILALATMFLCLRSLGLIGWAISSVPLAIATWLVYANLVTVPVAGIVIVLRRRACQS